MTVMTYDQAIHEVKAQVAASHSSFTTGMIALPKARREAMYALYGFCRAVDDIADDSFSPDIAKHKLQEWRKHIRDVFRGQARDAITTALLPAIRDFRLIEKDFQEIIDGMEMDSVAIVAPDLATLDVYCDRVASAVGRASVRIFGDDSDKAMQVSHHLGRAFQLTNILRDLGEDAARGRLYLPRELLEKHGITSRNSSEVIRAPQLPLVCRDLAVLAKKHYEQADHFIGQCPSWAMRSARIMRSYYGAIFERVVAADWQNPVQRICLPTWKKLWLMLKGLWA